MPEKNEEIRTNRLEQSWLITFAATTTVASCTDIISISTGSTSFESVSSLLYSVTFALMGSAGAWTWMREASGQ